MATRLYRKMSAPASSPGSLVAPEGANPTCIHVTVYDPDSMVVKDIETVEELGQFKDKHPVMWVDVQGLADTDTISRIGEMFDLHPLALEDVMNLTHRPKAERFSNCMFLISRSCKLLEDKSLTIEQISIFLGKNFVITFQEEEGDPFDPVRQRIARQPGTRIRNSGADYLAYALVDAVIDGYYGMLDQYALKLDDLEDGALDGKDDSIIHDIRDFRREVQSLRHALWPMRQMVDDFSDEETLIEESLHPFLRDCRDHVTEVGEVLETYRDRVGGVIDLYNTNLSNRMNEVMKLLTVIATIFMPLGFLAGIYGMNFDTGSRWNLPELGFAYGYPILLGVMVAIAVTLLMLFRKYGFIGQRKE